MVKEELREYPILVDPFLDFEATRSHFGRGSCNYALGEMNLGCGQTAVYLFQQREGQKSVPTRPELGRVCEQGIVVCGYRVSPRGILGLLKRPRIKTIPKSERESVELELREKLERKPEYVEFW